MTTSNQFVNFFYHTFQAEYQVMLFYPLAKLKFEELN